MKEPGGSSAQTPGPCPAWCDGVVCRETFSPDRYHQHDVVLPVISRVPPGCSRPEPTAQAEELNIALFTSVSLETEDGDIWVALEMAEVSRGVTLSLESMRRMYRRLGEVLGRATCSGER